MNFRYVPFLLPLTLSAATVLATMLYGIFHRRTRGATELVAVCAIGFLWVAANSLEMAGTDLPTKLFWASVQYISYAFMPFLWLALVLRIEGKDRYLTAANFLLVSVIPVITCALVWFDPVLGLVRHSFTLDQSGEYSVIAKQYGPWFWVHYVYSYSGNLLSLYELLGAVRKKGSIHRSQSFILLLALCLVLVSNLSYVVRLGPFKRNDLTPILFGFSSVLLWWGIFRFRLFKILPIERTTVFERMANGILVIDEGWNLLDSNGAARKMLSLDDPRLLGVSLHESVPALAMALEEFLIPGDSQNHPDAFQKEIRIETPEGDRFLEISASRLRDPRYETAWVIIITDITDLKRARERIVRQFQDLAAAEERERLSRELHDNLGQVLSFSVIQSDAIQRELGGDDNELASSHLTRLREILKGAHGDLRDLVHGIRDAGYASLTIGDILEKEADIFRGYCATEVAVIASPEDRALDLTLFQKNHVARILKEALNNIAKHARASRVIIRLYHSSGDCLLDMEDNGIGLPPEAVDSLDGSGIGIMSERAWCLGGRLEVCSPERGGTRLRLAFPLDTEKKNENTDR